MSGFNFGDAWDTDFFGNPKGGGCCVAAIILVGGLTLVGCGVTKGVKALTHKDNKPKTEQVAKNFVKPQNIIAYNNVKTY